MGLISRLGAWLDRLFSPKATTLQIQEIHERLNIIDKRDQMLETGLFNLHEAFNKNSGDSLKLRDELTAIKALYKIGGMAKPSAIPSSQQKFDGSMPWKR